MASNLFAKLEKEAFRKAITPRTKQSREWFRKQARQITTINRKRLMKAKELDVTANFVIGEMFMFFYDAKHADTLPYWDRFPLIIVVDFAPGGFYGINLHYLPMTLRAKFLDALLNTLNNKRYDESTRFRLSYKMLKASAKHKYFKPCFKHYLASNVQGNFAKVAPPEWEIAVFLPTADWQGATQHKVHRDSRQML